jgi:hypothetical protein
VPSLAEVAPGVLRSELEVTSSEARRGEFFRYGAEWRKPDGPTLRAWSEQLWRGEKKSKHAELGNAGVIDIVSGIAMLRRRLPESQQRLEIWSDGKLYPVIVLPRGEQRKRVGGREVATQHLSVRGITEPDRRVWKGELDLWLAHDAAATPVEILVTRGGARVRLLLTGYSPPPAVEPEPLARTEPEGSP